MRIRAKGAIAAVLAVLGTAALVAVGATIAVEQTVNAELLAQVLNQALGAATNGRYRVVVDHVDVSPWTGDLAVTGIRLRPQGSGSEGGTAVGPALRFSGDVGLVSIERVRLWRLVRHRDLEARAFRVSAPRVGVILTKREVPELLEPAAAAPPDERADDPGSTEAPTGDDSTETRHGAVARKLPHIQVGEVAIRDVDVTLVTVGRDERGATEAPLTDRLRGLTLTFEDLLVDPNEAPGADRFLFSRDVRLEWESLGIDVGSGGRVEVGALTASSRARTLQLDRLALAPGESPEEFLAGAGSGGDRVALDVGAVSVSGLAWWRLVEELDLVADTVRIDGLTIDVLSDKHRRRPGGGGSPAMPHDVIRELPLGLAIGTVDVSAAQVTYSERGPESLRPGSVTFADIQARIANVSNDPAWVADHGPAVLEAETRLFEAAPVRVRASLPLLAPPPTMSFYASVGPFEASEVNSILPDLEGLRVTDGHVDSARVDIRYGPGRASGGVMVGYRDLSIRQEDRNTGGQNVGQKLTSFLANTFVIRGSNQPDDGHGPRVGEVAHRSRPADPFFKIFWEAVRDGLIDVAKR